MIVQPNTQYENPAHYGRGSHGSSASTEIFSEFSNPKMKVEEGTKMQNDISVIKNLGKFLYSGTELEYDNCHYTNESSDCSDGSDLYTMIKYDGKDLLIKVGSGAFNTEVFESKSVPELKGFGVSSVPLFVVDQYNSEEINEITSPKNYLNQYAVIVAPPGGGAYHRSTTERENKKIDLNDIHIMHYTDAVSAMRTAILHKVFSNAEFDKCVKIIKKLQQMTPERFAREIKKDEKYRNLDPNPIMMKLIKCLAHMDVPQGYRSEEENTNAMYYLIHSFNVAKKSFIPHKYN